MAGAQVASALTLAARSLEDVTVRCTTSSELRRTSRPITQVAAASVALSPEATIMESDAAVAWLVDEDGDALGEPILLPNATAHGSARGQFVLRWNLGRSPEVVTAHMKAARNGVCTEYMSPRLRTWRAKVSAFGASNRNSNHDEDADASTLRAAVPSVSVHAGSLGRVARICCCEVSRSLELHFLFLRSDQNLVLGYAEPLEERGSHSEGRLCANFTLPDAVLGFAACAAAANTVICSPREGLSALIVSEAEASAPEPSSMCPNCLIARGVGLSHEFYLEFLQARGSAACEPYAIFVRALPDHIVVNSSQAALEAAAGLPVLGYQRDRAVRVGIGVDTSGLVGYLDCFDSSSSSSSSSSSPGTIPHRLSYTTFDVSALRLQYQQHLEQEAMAQYNATHVPSPPPLPSFPPMEPLIFPTDCPDCSMGTLGRTPSWRSVRHPWTSGSLIVHGGPLVTSMQDLAMKATLFLSLSAVLLLSLHWRCILWSRYQVPRLLMRTSSRGSSGQSLLRASRRGEAEDFESTTDVQREDTSNSIEMAPV